MTTKRLPDDGKNYSAATHAADLAAFIYQLNASPVHLVGLSMGGRLTAMIAVEHPDLLRSLTVLEPPLPRATVPRAIPSHEAERRWGFG